MLCALLVVALTAAAAYQVLSESQPRLSGTDSVFPSDPVVGVEPGQQICQTGRLPDHTRAVETPLEGGPPEGGLRLTVLDASGQPLAGSARDTRRAGWARFVLPRTLTGEEGYAVCIENVSVPGAVSFRGSPSREGLSLAGAAIPGAITLSYLRPGTESLLDMIPVVAERIGLIRGVITGPARTVLIVVLVLAGMALSGLLLAGRLGRRAALACAAVAVLNAAAFSLLTPLFQIPDEVAHVSYVQDLAVKGSPPKPGDPPSLAADLTYAVAASHAGAINFNPFARPVWDRAGERLELIPFTTTDPSSRNPGSFQNVVDYPPLYYATLVPVYAASRGLGANVLGAVTPMRLASALFAGVALLALFAMLTELFPGRRGLVVAVSLACAYQPVLVWISGGVNPDGALIALGATMFWLFARAFRRGLTTPVAIGLGLTMVAAALVQVRGLGLGPGWAVGVALLLWRSTPPGARWKRALAVAAPALAVATLYAVLATLVWDRPLIPSAVSSAATGNTGTVAANTGFLSFLWQYAFPRIGSMTDFFRVPWTVKDLWVPMWVGKFGWYDYQFPNSVNRAALLFYIAVALAAVYKLAPQLRRVPTVRLLTIVYLLLFAGIVFAIARVAYPMRAGGNLIFEQARYMLPLIGFYALALALAATVFKRRAALAAAAFVPICVVHLLFAFELTIQRYYL